MTSERKTVYLDYNATTPYATLVKEAMIDAAEHYWGNPSSNYQRGQKARKLVEESRKSVADMIGAEASEVIFVSGGTEANNVAIKSAIEEWKRKSKTVPHVISTEIEHDATLKPLEHLSSSGEIKVTFLATNSDGSVNPDDVVNAVQTGTVLVTLMLANNETGAITNLKKLSESLAGVNILREKENLGRVYLHIDAAQALGKISVSVEETPVDYLTIVGHKFYGPRTGALYVKEGRPLTPLVKGGSQEKHRRPGTENTVCIAGLGEASKLVRDNIAQYNDNYARMKEQLRNSLLKEFPKGACLINFPEVPERPQLPNTLSVSFPGLCGSRLLEKSPELEASTGAACHSSTNQNSASKMLLRLLPERQAIGTIRLSVGRETSASDIDLAVTYLREAVNRQTNCQD